MNCFLWFNDISNLIQLKIISINWTESHRIIEVTQFNPMSLMENPPLQKKNFKNPSRIHSCILLSVLPGHSISNNIWMRMHLIWIVSYGSMIYQILFNWKLLKVSIEQNLTELLKSLNSIHCHWWRIPHYRKRTWGIPPEFILVYCWVSCQDIQSPTIFGWECIWIELFLMETSEWMSLICLELNGINNWMQRIRSIGLSSTQSIVSESNWFTVAPSNS